MKVKLGVKDRLVLSGLLPQTGSFLNLKLIREAREALSFTDAEHKKFKLQVDKESGGVTWNIAADKEKEFEFGGVVVGLIVKALTDLDKKEQLNENNHMSLYQKFVLTDKE